MLLCQFHSSCDLDPFVDGSCSWSTVGSRPLLPDQPCSSLALLISSREIIAHRHWAGRHFWYLDDWENVLVSLLSNLSSNTTTTITIFIISLLSSKAYQAFLHSPKSSPNFSAWPPVFFSMAPLYPSNLISHYPSVCAPFHCLRSGHVVCRLLRLPF